MGSRGPVPKPDEMRRRRNADGGRRVVMVGAVVPPPVPRGLHPLVRKWYASLRNSAQSAYFEPSDWAAAQFTAVAMDRAIERSDARMFSAVWTAMKSLGTTEEARRRMHILAMRQEEDPEEGAVSTIDD